MRVLRAADRRATPWKNGGGVTSEVCAWPPGAGFDVFTWRVSMAEVRADGPFSLFPGVDRILAVLRGRLALSIGGTGDCDLTPDSPPAVFPGDVRTIGRLVESPVLDLNVMTRRGAASAHVERAVSPMELPATRGVRLVVALADGLGVQGPGGFEKLQLYDAILTEAPVSLEASAEAQALVIFLTTF